MDLVIRIRHDVHGESDQDEPCSPPMPVRCIQDASADKERTLPGTLAPRNELRVPQVSSKFAIPKDKTKFCDTTRYKKSIQIISN